MRVDLTSRIRRTDERKSTPLVDPLENRQLLSADFKAFGSTESVVTGVVENIDVAYYTTSRNGHIDGATIDWGDGSSPTTGTVSPLVSAEALGSLGSIEGDHSYAATGTYTVKTTLVEHVEGGPDVTSTVTGTLNVVAPSITASPGRTLVGAAGQVITDQTLAFVQTNIPSADKAFQVTIDWGDGTTPSTGTISPAKGLGDVLPSLASFGAGDGSRPYVVTGSHTYITAGLYTAKVTLDDGAGDTATASTPVTIATTSLVATSPSDLNAVSGLAISGPLARVVDIATGASLDASSLTATIDWGDGSTPGTGEVHGDRYSLHSSAGQPTYLIFGSHLYAQAGDETVTITVSDKNGRTATTKTTVHVQGETITASPTPIAATTGLDGIYQVASGTDAPIVRGNHLTATIDWGDGSTPTTGDVVPTGGLFHDHDDSTTSTAFTVVGDHPYATAGTYKVHVTITSDGGATTTADSTATVTSFSAFGVPKFARAGTALTGEAVAVIAMPGSTTSASDFTATIDWGDGSAADSATIVSKNLPHGPWLDAVSSTKNILLVDGTHTYASAGTFTAKITISDTRTGESTIVTSTIKVVAASPSPVDTTGGNTGSTGATTGDDSGGGATLVPISGTPIATTTPTTTTVPASSPKFFHSKKGSVKITHHTKIVVKTHAHHPHGPLG